MSEPLTRMRLVTAFLLIALTQGAAMQDDPPAGAALPDGTPLEANQFPRFLRPTHEDQFGFDNLLVLGDHPMLRFERRDLTRDAGISVESWSRTETAELGGRMVSVFRLEWPVSVLHEALATHRWGVDRPYLRWGDIVVPSAGPDARRRLYLQMAPPNVPPAPLVQATQTVQYSSHVVNIWVPGFAESRARGGERDLDLTSVTMPFYDAFEDAHETLAIVSQTSLLSDFSGWRRNVRNDITGIGLPVFDSSREYGSRGVLQGIEVYPPGGWATAQSTLHQQVHQWGEYSNLWAQLGLVREGREPARHTPLLSPGAFIAGAVLEGTRRVVAADPATFEIERTMPAFRFHPLTLYRMGLIGLPEVPELRVFQDQGQFDPIDRAAPPVGTGVQGGHLSIFPNDFLAADGARGGPPVSQVRRALIYVSRDGLALPAEMDVLNFFAARLEATEGVTSWEGYPSFYEAAGGLAVLTTDVTPRPGLAPQGKLDGVAAGSDWDVAIDALTGVRLDQPIPGRIAVGQTLRLAGTVTAEDAENTNIACFRFIRYGSTDPNEIFICASLSARRFSMDVEFTANQRGRYTVEPFLFAADAREPTARARYGVMTVE